jgi:thiol-disulfide isomerase/thioredoxin
MTFEKMQHPAKAHPTGGLASLGSATGWLNSPPLTVAGLRGTVVLIDFWTYSCINWLRSVPYVRAWAEKYKDQGLVVIGVHTPEFAFEKNDDSVRQAAKDMMVDYPIAIDTTTRYGKRSRTNTGRHSISSMRRGRFDIINSAKANTNSRK